MKIKFIFVPNLPQNRVKAVIIGEKYHNLSLILNNMGIVTILVKGNCELSPNIESHADMSVFHYGNNGFIVSKSINYNDFQLNNLDFEIITTNEPKTDKYPYDIALNACLVGNKLFHKLSYTDKHIIDLANINNWIKIEVNQGYTKCSICILDETHIITSDIGIHKKAKSNGIDSLLISPGQIELDGFNTGFIGGATGKISKTEIAFTGTLKYHKDEKLIIEYIRQIGMKPVFLSDEPIYDVGSIIPILEIAQ